jgi:hypothetical protein
VALMVAAVSELALARVRAAERLDAAIVALGNSYRLYQQATKALEDGAEAEDLGRYLEGAIVRHMVVAGLGAFLERKLDGAAPPLASLVETQHGRAGWIG